MSAVEKRLLELGDEVRRVLDVPADPAMARDTRQLLTERVGRGVAAPSWGRLPLTAALVAVFALVVGIAGSKRFERPISFQVDARHGELGSVLVAPEERELLLSFSEGTQVALLSGARARVERLGARGADITLERGAARVSVNHRALAQWRVNAGPFAVAVTGTRFLVAWNAAEDSLRVDLYQGSVEVTGCALTVPQQLVAGQRMLAQCGSGRVSLTPLGEGAKLDGARVAAESSSGAVASGEVTTESPPKAVASVTSRDLPLPPVRPAGMPSSAAAALAPVAPAPADWRTLARAGHFSPAFEAATAAGFESELAGAGLDEVSLYADVARLAAHAAEARHAYEVLRRRFPGSSQASAAAFALGRLALDRGEQASATTWLETYLREAPSGSLASVALGRLLEVSVQRGDVVRARELANQYLTRFPTGAHADNARKILSVAPTEADRMP